VANAQGGVLTYDQAKARYCPPGGVVRAPAILFGRVLDADTDAPLAGANVSLVYTDSLAQPPAERVRRARSADDGTFAICGLPERIAGTVQAARGALTTPEVPIAFTDRLLGGAVLTLNVSGATRAVLQGRVLARSGAPVAGAQVAVEGTSANAVTGADGAFSLSGLPSGTHTTVARKIGYAPATVAVNLTTLRPREVTVTMSDARLLEAVRVVGKLDDALKQIGFEDRKRFGRGRFISPEEVEQRNPLLFTDLLQTVPGLTVRSSGSGRVVQATRNTGLSEAGCVIIFVDHARFEQMQPGDLDEAFHAVNVGAVEIYSSPADVPAEFQVSGRACTTIAMWTKTKLARP